MAERLRVLFVDDEKPIRDVMEMELPRMGHDVTTCEDGDSAVRALEQYRFDAAIVDLRMPGLSGWDVVEHLKKTSPETEFVISTAHGNIDDAIRAVRQGAYDFLPKPSKLFEIANVLKRIGEKRTLTNKAIALESRLTAVEGKSNLIGNTPVMQRVQKLSERISPTDSSVLILGETGTGKELVARRIHDLSRRCSAPFVPINCGALPENLVESEFFGHRKGAFTGADTARKGLIEVADGGTLFLDELGELNKQMQVKLLRFLESGEVRRVGENEPFLVDVRIVCATNCDLQEMVSEGAFREDLYFRVNTFEIPLPPLRERKEDIPTLARHLLHRYLKKQEMSDAILSADAIDVLIEHDWPGNVRELANVLEYAATLADTGTIMPEDLPQRIKQVASTTPPHSNSTHAQSVQRTIHSTGTPLPERIRNFEMDTIQHVLRKYHGNKTAAAAELGITVRTLYNKLSHESRR